MNFSGFSYIRLASCRILLITLLYVSIPYTALAATSSVSANHSAGSILLGGNTNTCNSGLTGAVRFTSSTGVLDFCNGTNWLSTVLSNGGFVSNCVSANKGALRYNSAGSSNTAIIGGAPVVASSSSSVQASGGVSIAKPTGTAAGDLLVFIVANDSGSAPIPSGFTDVGAGVLGTSGGDGQMMAAAYKIAGSSEPSTYTTADQGSDSSSVLLRITGADTIAPIDKQIGFATTSTTTVPPSKTATVATMTPANDYSLIIWAVGPDSGNSGTASFTDPSGYTHLLGPLNTGSWTSLEVATAAQTTKAATGAISGSIGFSTSVSMGYLSYGIVIKAANPVPTIIKNSNYVQVCDGSNWTYVGSGGAPGGSNTQVQFNSGGLMTGNSNFTWDRSAYNLGISGRYLINNTNGLTLTSNGQPILGNTGMSASLAPLSLAAGVGALNSVTGEVNSIAIGQSALYYTSSSLNNTAIGSSVLSNHTTGNSNTGIGTNALLEYQAASENTAIGYTAMQGGYGPVATGGNNNTFGGSAAAFGPLSGSDNVGFGRRIMMNEPTGSKNATINGISLGSNNVSLNGLCCVSAGNSNNTQIGNSGSNITTGASNILIADADPPNGTTSNQIDIAGLIYADMSAGIVGLGMANGYSGFTINPPSSQTVTAGATITVKGCNSIKNVTSSANRITSTTDTFTTPTSAYAGCCMDVYNSGSNTITLKHNANFKTAGGVDLSLGPIGVVRVCTDGNIWYQAGGIVTNN